jgi:hypothetical protein
VGDGASGEDLVTLNTPRLILRQWQPTDLDRYVDRARAGPIVVTVPAVRAAADQDGRRRWPADPGQASEHRADALTGYPVRRQTIQSFYTAGHC